MCVSASVRVCMCLMLLFKRAPKFFFSFHATTARMPTTTSPEHGNFCRSCLAGRVAGWLAACVCVIVCALNCRHL